MNRRNFLSALIAAPIVHEVEPVRRVYSFLWSNPYAPIVLRAVGEPGQQWQRSWHAGQLEMRFSEVYPGERSPLMIAHMATPALIASPLGPSVLEQEREMLRKALESHARKLGRLGRIELRI